MSNLKAAPNWTFMIMYYSATIAPLLLVLILAVSVAIHLHCCVVNCNNASVVLTAFSVIVIIKCLILCTDFGSFTEIREILCDTFS